MILVGNARIWSFGVKTLVFGSKSRKKTHLRAPHGLARGHSRAVTRAGVCPRNAVFVQLSFGVFLIGII